MSKTALLFGIHMHQPVDNFDWVIDMRLAVCYKPFFEVMSRYPSFRFQCPLQRLADGADRTTRSHPLQTDPKTLPKGEYRIFQCGVL
jgi:hypothetical protein